MFWFSVSLPTFLLSGLCPSLLVLGWVGLTWLLASTFPGLQLIQGNQLTHLAHLAVPPQFVADHPVITLAPESSLLDLCLHFFCVIFTHASQSCVLSRDCLQSCVSGLCRLHPRAPASCLSQLLKCLTYHQPPCLHVGAAFSLCLSPSKAVKGMKWIGNCALQDTHSTLWQDGSLYQTIQWIKEKDVVQTVHRLCNT